MIVKRDTIGHYVQEAIRRILVGAGSVVFRVSAVCAGTECGICRSVDLT